MNATGFDEKQIPPLESKASVGMTKNLENKQSVVRSAHLSQGMTRASTRKVIDDIDGGLNLDRLSVEMIGLVTPGADGFERALAE